MIDRSKFNLLQERKMLRQAEVCLIYNKNEKQVVNYKERQEGNGDYGDWCS